MADGPVFAAFVRPVRGHAVPRYGTAQFLGCTRGAKGFEWDEQTIIPLTDEYCRAYVRELNQHFAEGSLVSCTDKQYATQLAQSIKQASGGTTTEESDK